MLLGKVKKKIRVPVIAHCHSCLDWFELDAVFKGSKILKLENHGRIKYYGCPPKPYHTCNENGGGYLTFYRLRS